MMPLLPRSLRRRLPQSGPGPAGPDPGSRPATVARAVGLVLVLLALSACGDDATDPGVNPDVAFLVGSWEAESFVVTSVADPSQSLDLVATGSSFLFTVEPSGRYQASLTVFGSTSTVFGRLELTGQAVTLFQEFPTQDTQTGTLEQISADRVRLTAETSFDFDLNGEPDPAVFTAELVRTSS